MQQYKDFSPTAMDSKGLNLPDQQDWFVVSVSQTRDSGVLELSNFRSVLADLGGEDNEDLEVHRFGHWGPGWFEIIIVKPGTETAKKVEEWEDKLSDYPVANEDDYSTLEIETAQEYWDTLSIREKWEYIERDGGLEQGESIFSMRHSIPHTVTGEIFYHLAS